MKRKKKATGGKKRKPCEEVMWMAVSKDHVAYPFLPWGWGSSRDKVHEEMSLYRCKWPKSDYRIVQIRIVELPLRKRSK